MSDVEENKREEIRLKIRELLQTTGEGEKIRASAEAKLAKGRWNKVVRRATRRYLREKGVQSFNYQEMYDHMLPIAREAIPQEVRVRTLEKVKAFVAKRNFEV